MDEGIEEVYQEDVEPDNAEPLQDEYVDIIPIQEVEEETEEETTPEQTQQQQQESQTQTVAVDSAQWQYVVSTIKLQNTLNMLTLLLVAATFGALLTRYFTEGVRR